MRKGKVSLSHISSLAIFTLTEMDFASMKILRLVLRINFEPTGK